MTLPLLFVFALAAPAPTPDAEIRAAADVLSARLVEVRRDIHQHPELGNRETRTGTLVAERLRALGLEVRHPVAKTGAVGILRGGRPGPVVALRADLDALPIQERNDVPYKSQVPGVKHACGHDAHTAIVLGVAEVLSGLKAKLPGTVVFVFQPAEEGPPEGEDGGAELMIAEGLLRDTRPVAMFGLHMDPLLPAGEVGWAAGPIFASADTFKVVVEGRKTHGAYPHTGLDPVPVAAEIVSALQLVVSRQIDTQQPKVLTIGSIHGGNRFNIVAHEVTMEGTLRTLDPAVRTAIREKMARTVTGVGAAHGTTAILTWRDAGTPATLNDEALTRAAVPSLERAWGAGRAREVKPQMGAEDFALFAAAVPALYVKIGTRNEAKGITAMIHTEDFDIDETVLPIAVRGMATLVWDTLVRLGGSR